MHVLVVGGGGREHAIVDALHRAPSVDVITCAPGNPGIAQLATCVPTDGSIADLVVRARELQPDLVVVGPEAPLAAGLADELRATGLPVVGPGADGAQLEASKWFAKELLLDAGVRTAKAQRFTRFDEAAAFVRAVGAPVVVKADGLAAGKGVVVAHDVDAAIEALRGALLDERFGTAGASVVVEEFLDGPELSVLALVSGDQIRMLAPARDHKRAFDGDSGPNTGGMGAVCPPPDADAELLARVDAEVLRPTIAELGRRGIDFRGVLYAGLMLTADGPSVIEFNVRFGDPEAQAILPRLRSDAGELLRAVARGTLADAPEIEWDERAAVTVVVAAEGYPATPRIGDTIDLDAPADDATWHFHAGTARGTDGILRSAGGRVIAVTALADDLDAARAAANAAAAQVRFAGAWHRTDIAATSTLTPA